MTAVLVADPRPMAQAFLERVLADRGYAVEGPPDLVLTPEGATIRFWARRGIPVVAYHADDELDLDDLLAHVGTAFDPT
jgi:hypothetical protein